MILTVLKGSDWRGVDESVQLICTLMLQYLELLTDSGLHENFEHGHWKGLDIFKSINQPTTLHGIIY